MHLHKTSKHKTSLRDCNDTAYITFHYNTNERSLEISLNLHLHMNLILPLAQEPKQSMSQCMNF
jgi:hypothetical protein